MAGAGAAGPSTSAKVRKGKGELFRGHFKKREMESNSSGRTVTFAWGMRNMSATRQSRVTAGRGPSDISVLTFGRF